MSNALKLLALALSAALLPLSAAAEKHDNAGKAQHMRVQKPAHVQKNIGPGKPPFAAEYKSPRRDVVRHLSDACPPGLAKKSPACGPPGLTKKAVVVGEAFPSDRIHWITRPGLYGLGEPKAGSRYAIIDGKLVRVNRDDNRVLSIIRLVDAILD